MILDVPVVYRPRVQSRDRLYRSRPECMYDTLVAGLQTFYEPFTVQFERPGLARSYTPDFLETSTGEGKLVEVKYDIESFGETGTRRATARRLLCAMRALQCGGFWVTQAEAFRVEHAVDACADFPAAVKLEKVFVHDQDAWDYFKRVRGINDYEVH